MKYINKKLAEIAKEKGFNKTCTKCYNTSKTLENNNEIINFDSRFYKQDIILSPDYQDLIEWIFNETGDLSNISKGSSSYKPLMNANIEWLEFWYNTIISEIIDLNNYNITNKSVLGILNEWLIDWFTLNNMSININKEIYLLLRKNELNNTNSYTGINGGSLLKLQARHFAILECFKIMKQ